MATTFDDLLRLAENLGSSANPNPSADDGKNAGKELGTLAHLCHPRQDDGWKEVFSAHQTIFDTRTAYRYPEDTVDQLRTQTRAWDEEAEMLRRVHVEATAGALDESKTGAERNQLGRVAAYLARCRECAFQHSRSRERRIISLNLESARKAHSAGVRRCGVGGK